MDIILALNKQDNFNPTEQFIADFILFVCQIKLDKISLSA